MVGPAHSSCVTPSSSLPASSPAWRPARAAFAACPSVRLTQGELGRGGQLTCAHARIAHVSCTAGWCCGRRPGRQAAPAPGGTPAVAPTVSVAPKQAPAAAQPPPPPPAKPSTWAQAAGQCARWPPDCLSPRSWRAHPAATRLVLGLPLQAEAAAGALPTTAVALAAAADVARPEADVARVALGPAARRVRAPTARPPAPPASHALPLRPRPLP